MKISSRHIEVFRAVMLSRSVTRAAGELRTSQPTASRFLSELERASGFSLFLREGGRLTPTPEALALFQEVTRSFLGMEHVQAAIRGIASFDSERLRISSIPSMSLGPLPRAVRAFLDRYQAAGVSLDVHAMNEVIARITSRQSDIGFTAYPTDQAGIRSDYLMSVAGVCVMPEGHALANQGEVNVLALHNMPFISLEGQSRERIDKMFEQHGVKRKLAVETQTGSVAASLVRQGVGLVVLDPFTAHAMGKAGLVIRPFAPRLEFNFYALMRSGEEPPRIVSEFLNVLREEIKVIQGEDLALVEHPPSAQADRS
jgi:DNA-binding transcriptional LysR family regulator